MQRRSAGLQYYLLYDVMQQHLLLVPSKLVNCHVLRTPWLQKHRIFTDLTKCFQIYRRLDTTVFTGSAALHAKFKVTFIFSNVLQDFSLLDSDTVDSDRKHRKRKRNKKRTRERKREREGERYNMQYWPQLEFNLGAMCLVHQVTRTLL